MGYARLYFPNDGTVLAYRVIHDIAGVLTGNITQVSNLTASNDTRAYSQIINTANSNWQTMFPSSFTWATPSTASTSVVLQAPCVTAGKTKYIRIGQFYNSAFSTTTTANYNFNMSSTTAVGLLMQSCTGASSATSLTNQTTWNTYTTSTAAYTHSIAGNYVILHWSDRHCIMTGYKTTSTDQLGRRILMAAMEHNETPITQWAATAPVTHVVVDSFRISNSTASVDFNYTGAYTGTGGTNMGSTSFTFMTEMQHYNNVTQVATGVYNPLNDTTTNTLKDDMTLLTGVNTDYPTVSTKTNTGSVAIYMQPLFYHQHTLGIPHMYYSNLTGVYRVTPGLGSEGDIITVGADSYAYMPVANWYALAVKRA
jgi:hypothetical protein